MQQLTQPSANLEGYELSPQQKHLWVVHQLTGENAVQPYRVQAAISITGAIAPTIFQAALQDVIDRYEILRTTFQSAPGLDLPLQVIQETPTEAIATLDWSQLSASEQAVELKNLWQQWQAQNLPLEQSLQWCLIRQSSEQHCLMLSLSALCGDAATLKNLVQEIAQQYAVCLQASPSLEAEEPLQYADLATWQNELLQENSATPNYWRKLEDTGLETLSLPVQPTQKNAALQPKKLFWTAPEGLVAQMERNAIADALLTAWQILLWRLTGQEALTLGVSLDGRNYEELEPAIGLLTRTLPLSSQLQPNLTFQQALKQVQATRQEMALHQDAFAWAQGLPIQGAGLETRVLPLTFEFIEQSDSWETAGIRYAIAQVESCTDYFWIKLCGIQQADGLTAELNYNAAQFKAADMQRLFEELQTLLTHAIQAPDTAIAQLEILSPAEREQLLVTFNQTATNLPPFECLTPWFEAQVCRTPDEIAVILGDRHLTYAQLNARANQLAHYLRSQGVGADTLLGLCVERSLEMVVALLGILKAGGAYVPIDPGYPRDRIAFILSDTQTPLLLTQSHLLSQLPAAQTPIFCLDRDWHTVATFPTENPDFVTAPDHLAYVIYTSGSTGQPKGALIHHRGLTNYLNWAIQAYEVAQGEGSLVHSSLAFDLTVTSLWSPLLVGRSVELLPDDPSLETLRDALVRRRNLSLVKITPAHLSVLSQQLSLEQVRGCTRRFIIGGENLTAESLSFWRKAAPETLLVNEYGPTETVVGCCVYTVAPDDPEAGSVPIGRPIANTQLYILDEHLQPVPIGVVGELFIGGAGLARGYLNRPELTNERFIPNPFQQAVSSLSNGQRLYKTGDLARYRPDGTLEYLGRTDHQVKLKGFRIELGEIETLLRQHPEVQDAIALVHTNTSGQQRLVAYVVPESPTETVTSETLRSHLQARLPEYMVPAICMSVAAFPLTANGKVDRRALPDSTAQAQNRQAQFIAPTTPAEANLAKIWAQLLRLERVGIHDNFFELGGDSILSIQMTARANQAGLRITPKQVFEHQTIAKLAAIAAPATAVIAEQGKITGALPLTPIQHWFFEQNIAESHHWNQSLLLEVQQPLTPEVLQQIVTHLIQHHDVLRSQFTQTGNAWTAAHADQDIPAPVTVVDLSGEVEIVQRQKITAIASELQAQLSLDQAPLMRVVLFQLGAYQPSRLLIVVHHLLIDGVSWRILLEDFQTAYAQLQHQQPIQLSAKTTSFQQWGEALQTYARSQTLQQEQAFWLHQARQAQQHDVSLPVDYSSGGNTVGRSQTITLTLTPDETQVLLRDLPTKHQVQIQEVLLTALTQTLTAWTGQSALWVDLEGHGREEISEAIDLSRTVGWFTAIFPRLLHYKSQDALSLLKSIQNQLRQVPNNGIGYGILRYLSQEPELQAVPHPHVCFNYLGQTDATFNTASLFHPAQESTGASRSPQGRRSHLLEINCIIAERQLRVHWTFSNAIHQAATIENLTQQFHENLRSLLSLKQQTPPTSSFSAANLSLSDLQKLMAQLQSGKKR
ncbi:amino acid adenylation domain-containing protein [Trichocoleus sp. FACHB-591]|uniref:non-ribosomal peptide synthetase n=1 Tax=Trichocoleus sp. FACHB-591 TaxID=2692872 RepID=UPI001688E733|nr:non-ribosomal peptide synthetase [Trichocoleus sp. FACHB-591]MBD2095648.1 amino acid adenylation domain-containing protein [Trichocoleus sp. FACHB-591]